MVSVPKAHPELRDGLSEEGREGHRQQGTDSHFGQTTPEMVSVPNGFSPLSPALSGGGDRVLVIGADSPQVPPERLREAAAALDRADLVLGPTDDGGYYALGLRRWAAGLLDGVRWSTEHALADTLSRARALGLSCELLPPAYDVDDAASLWRLVEELEHLPPDRLRHTRAALPAGYRREP
jgi:hypothetical protein